MSMMLLFNTFFTTGNNMLFIHFEIIAIVMEFNADQVADVSTELMPVEMSLKRSMGTYRHLYTSPCKQLLKSMKI
jgi:hypothetical protein